VDVFPSLHFGASFFLLVFDWQHHRARFWRLLGPCAAMWFSTLYLRYHYFVDLLGGLVIAVAGVLAAWCCERRLAPVHDSFAGAIRPARAERD
jgi:membrane-associated phospholipid phosphatase